MEKNAKPNNENDTCKNTDETVPSKITDGMLLDTSKNSASLGKENNASLDKTDETVPSKITNSMLLDTSKSSASLGKESNASLDKIGPGEVENTVLDPSLNEADDGEIEKQFGLGKGSRFGNYEIIHKIGAGGMGVVYKAYDTKIRRNAAIKFILLPGGKKREKALKRFLQESQICASLSHPNIVKVYDAGQFDDKPYLVMEYIEGNTLLDYFDKHSCSLREKMAILSKVAKALHYAHTQNVIHRDVKPSNIMVRDDGEPVLMDFGLAKMVEKEERSLTATGEIMGSMHYMSPEQAEGRKHDVDWRTDVYGLGAVLYHVLTGTTAVCGDTMIHIVCQILSQEPKLPRDVNPAIPAVLEEICMTCMEKKKTKRYKSALEVATKLMQYAEGKKQNAGYTYLVRRQFKRYRRYYHIHKSGILITLAAFVLVAMISCTFFLFDNHHSPPNKNISIKSDEQIYWEEAIGKYKLRNYQDALQSLSHAMEIAQGKNEKNILHYFFAKGRILYEQGYIEDAYFNFEKALGVYAPDIEKNSIDIAENMTSPSSAELQPGFTKILYFLGSSAERLRKYEDAYEHYFALYERQSTLKHNFYPPEEIDLWLGRVCVQIGKYDLALDYLRSATARSCKPEICMESLYYKGKAKDALQRHTEAEDDWKMALEYSHSASGQAHFLEIRKHLLYCLGQKYFERKDFEQCIKNMEAAYLIIQNNFEMDTNTVQILGILANAYFQTKQWDKSIEYFSQAIEMEPWQYDYYYKRALCYNERMMFERAELDFSTCIRLRPYEVEPCIQIMNNIFKEEPVKNFNKMYCLFRNISYFVPNIVEYDIFEKEKTRLNHLVRSDCLSFEKKERLDGKKLDSLLKWLVESNSRSAHEMAEREILSISYDPVVYQRVRILENNIPNEAAKQRVSNVLRSIEQKWIPQFQAYLVRKYSYRDRQSLVRIYHKKELGVYCLLSILQNDQENGILRFWAACALADLRTQLSHHVIQKEIEEGDSVSRLISAIVWEEFLQKYRKKSDLKRDDTLEKILQDAPKIADIYVRAMAVSHIAPQRHSPIVEQFLKDKDEKVRLLAAAKAWDEEEKSLEEMAEQELLRGLQHPDPIVRSFCISHYWNMESISSLFTVVDFKEPAKFIGKLRRNSDLVSSRLKANLSSDFQQQIDAYRDGDEHSKDFLYTLVSEFNRLLAMPLYKQKIFEGVKLSEETQKLLSSKAIKDFQVEELRRLNRLLLEDAYPYEIAKSRISENWREKRMDRMKKYIPELIQATKSTNVDVRRTALVSLVKWDSSEHTEVFKAACYDADTLTRIQVIGILGRRNRTRLIFPIMEGENEPFIIRSICMICLYSAIDRFSMIDWLNMFEKMRKAKDERIRTLAYLALSWLDFRLVEKVLIFGSHETDDNSRMACIISMGIHNKDKFLPRLKEMLKDSSSRVRTLAGANILFQKQIQEFSSFEKEMDVANNPEMRKALAYGYFQMVYKAVPSVQEKYRITWDWEKNYRNYTYRIIAMAGNVPFSGPSELQRSPSSLQDYIEILGRAIRLESQNAEMYLERGILQYMAGFRREKERAVWYQKSLSDMERASEINPTRQIYKYWLATLYTVNRCHEKAIPLIQNVLEIDPWSEYFWDLLVQNLQSAGKTAQYNDAQEVLQYISQFYSEEQ